MLLNCRISISVVAKLSSLNPSLSTLSSLRLPRLLCRQNYPFPPSSFCSALSPKLDIIYQGASSRLISPHKIPILRWVTLHPGLQSPASSPNLFSHRAFSSAFLHYSTMNREGPNGIMLGFICSAWFSLS